MSAHQWIRNPDTGGVWQCPTPVLPAFLARGWEECDEPEGDDAHLHDPAPESPASEPEKPTSKAARGGQSTAKEQ